MQKAVGVMVMVPGEGRRFRKSWINMPSGLGRPPACGWREDRAGQTTCTDEVNNCCFETRIAERGHPPLRMISRKPSPAYPDPEEALRVHTATTALP